MSYLNHSLYTDFPQYHSRINQLKLENENFARMAASYHKIDHHIHGLQMRDIPVTDEAFSAMKTRRSRLKDQLYQIILKQ
jgi:uncharacterized protein YdcH (DUF465 family)